MIRILDTSDTTLNGGLAPSGQGDHSIQPLRKNDQGCESDGQDGDDCHGTYGYPLHTPGHG
jgi:hypothetical protein